MAIISFSKCLVNFWFHTVNKQLVLHLFNLPGTETFLLLSQSSCSNETAAVRRGCRLGRDINMDHNKLFGEMTHTSVSWCGGVNRLTAAEHDGTFKLNSLTRGFALTSSLSHDNASNSELETEKQSRTN